MAESAEDRIARVVREAIATATAEMERVVVARLAEGKPIDSKMLVQMANELTRLAEEYGQRIVVDGELGKLMTAERIAGAKAGGASPEWLVLNKEALDMALDNDKVKIVGLLKGNADTINEIIAGARISMKSRRDVVAEIMARVETEKELTKARAETIYRSETFGAARMFEHAAAVADGIEYFQQRGTIDSRTTALCLSHIGQIKTEQEWLDIEPLVFQYGLHYNCRCHWTPVVNPENKLVLAREKQARELAAKQQALRKKKAA